MTHFCAIVLFDCVRDTDPASADPASENKPIASCSAGSGTQQTRSGFVVKEEVGKRRGSVTGLS